MRRSLGAKIIVFLLTCLLLCAFVACTNTENGETQTPDPDSDPNASAKVEYTVAVYNGTNIIIDKYAAGTVLAVTADDIDGKVFVCWNHNGQTYSFDKNLSYTVDKDSVFKAVYSVNAYVELDAVDGVMSVTDTGSVIKSITYSEHIRPVFEIGGTPEIVGVVAASKTLSADLSPLTGRCYSYLYTWQRSDARDGDYTDIEGATAQTYTLTTEDVGRYVRVAVTGSSGYAGTVYSAPTPKIATAAAVSNATELTSSGATGNKDAATKASLVLVEGYYFSLPVPQKPHYTFVGWYNGDERITDGNGASDNVAAGRLSLTARYEENGKVFVHSYRDVDGVTSVYDKSEYYLEEGSVYTTAETIEDHECIVWEERARYLPLEVKPIDWANKYDCYYILSGDEYVPNTSREWDENASYAYLFVGGKTVMEKPSDWSIAYGDYYVVTLTQNDSDFWYGGARFKKTYALLTEKPADWATAYGEYYVLTQEGEYAVNTSSEWSNGAFYREKFSRIERIPSDWTTAYANYYNASFAKNDSEVWSDKTIYYDFRLSEANNPSFMVLRLTGMKEKSLIECVAVYREAYRVSVSGGMGTGYYGAEETISLRAIVTAGKAFDKWSVVRDGVTYYLVRYGRNGKIAVAYASSGTMVVGYLDGSVYKKTPFFIENTVADFGAGKYDVSYYYPLMEKPENWSSGYAAYYVFENGNYALNSSSEWKENATYYKKITAEKKFYRKEYVLLESEPADWADAFSTYYVCSGRNYLQNNNAAFAPDTFYRLTFTRLKDEPDDWTTAYGSYYTTAASYLSVTDEFCLADLEKLGLPIGGGCKVTAGFEQTDYVLRYELNLNVGDNRVSDDPQVKSALNDMGFFDADDGLFVYNQLLHYNDTIPWVSLPAITHYNFNGWQMLNGEARPTTMPRPKDGEVLTVVGTFSAEKYLITVMSGANGQARIGSTTGVESGYYSYGDTIRIFVTANAGYQLKDWTYGEGRVLFDAGDPQSASGSILRYDSEDDTEETIIYYFFYKITGDASDDDKSIKCSFTEREYKIVYRINYIYDDEDVTGEEFYTQEFTSAWKDGLTYIKETTNVQYYRVYYALGGQVTQDDLNAAMKYIGVDYVYNGTLSGGNVDLNNAATVTIGGREYYKLPIKKTNGVETKNILCYTYYGVSKMDYVSEQAISYREDLLGRQGFAITATDSAFYNSTASIATAPTAKELNMPYSAGVVYWRFSNWTANYSEANQTPSAFTMPMRTVIVTGTYTISEYDLTIAMGGEGSNTLRYVSVNGRDPSYYEGDDVCLRIPYNSVVEVEYQLKTGYDFTEITCIQNGQGQTIASDPQEKTKYVYYVKFNFASGEDMTYTLGSESVDYILTSYLRVDRENAESTEYLLSRSGLNVDMSRTKRIDSNVYYFFRIDRQMLYQDTLSDHTEVPSASLLETCNYVFGHWNYVYEEDGDYVAYTDARMPDKDLIAYTTLTIKTFGVEVVTDTQYDFDPIGTDTGVYLTATPVSKATVNNLPAYDYYTAFNLSYILPLGYHFDNWTITNTGTGSATALQSGAYFRRTYEPLSARPTDWTTKYGSYYIKLEGADGKYVLNNDPDTASVWDSGKDYYKLTGMYSIPDFPEDRSERDDLYAFYSFAINTDSTWKWTEGSAFFYAEAEYVLLAEKPGDWDKNYAEYYIGNGVSFEKNVSAAWSVGTSYYYLGLVRLMTQPDDFTQKYNTYYKVTPSSYRYIMDQNEYEGEYFRSQLSDIDEEPADWATNYYSYFVKDGGKYVRNLSASWDAEKTYAKVVGYESANVADDVQADIARYDLFIRVQNIDRAWDVSIVYVKLTQIALTERPADWSTAYSSYYVKNNGVYAPNTSNVWHDDYEYAYLGYVSVSEQPADWESDYASYWRLIAAPEWYKPGQKVTVTELTLFVNSDIRVAAKFSKDTFKAEVVVVGGNPGIITIGQAEPAVGSYKMDEIKFEYHSKIGISLRAESIPDGQSIRSISVYINKNDGLTFNLLDYDGLMTEDFDPLLNTDTYEYGVNGFVTDENYIGNIFVVVTMTSIQYKISYVVYTDLDSLADLSENNKITLDWAENATEGSFYELRNKFRIGYNVSFNLNNFLSGDETLSLLTDAQVAGIGGGARNDFLVVNWFLDQPTAATVQGDILQTYKHVKKDVDHPVGNIVVYGLLLNLFRLQVTSNEVALGFNKYVTDAFNNVYDRNISSLVVPTVFRDKNQDVVRNVTRYGFTSDTTNEQYYFSNNGKIKSLTFGESLEYVSFRAFNGCTALTTVTMAEGVCEIGGEAFKGCSSLSEINFPVSLIRFGDSAFSGTALTSVTIGNELPAGYTETRVYGAEVFSNIPTLAEVHFNANTKNTDAGRTTSITGGGLFRNSGSGVVGGMTLYVEGNVNYLDSNLFGYKQGQSGNGTYLKNVVFAGSGSSVEIPAGAFRMTGLTSVTIGSRVSSVGENAFRECTSLAEVVFADDCALTTIADRCFYFCTLLNEIVLPVGVTSIGNSAFAGTGSLTAVYYPMTGIASALTQIGENAFGSGENSAGTLTVRSGLKRFLPVSQKGVTGNNVEIPSSVTSIGKSAFACSAIERLILGGNNLAIGQKAFYDLAETVGANKHSTLTYLEYNVSGTVTIDCPVGEEADIFSLALTTTLGENCSIVIGSSTAQIPSVFFKGMTVATSLTIGANVTTIGEKAFYGMTGLTTVNYNAANVTGTTIATLAFGGSGNNATIVFGKSVKNLPDYLFKGANGIKYLDFSPVTSNDASASLTVGTGVFDGLTQITSIEFFKMRALTLKDGALLGMNALTSLTIAQDIGTFTVGMNSINKDTSFTVLSFPGFTFSNQRYPLEITEGTFVTAYDNGAHNYTLSVNSEMYTSAAGTFSVARGDSLTVAGTIRLRTHLYVYGTMGIGNSGGNVIRETGGVTGNIYGCVYTEDDLIGKNASGTVYTHLKQMDSFALTANIDLSEKTEYQLPANITLTVNAGKVLSVGKRFICDGHVVVNGKLALASKEIVNLAGDVTVAANAGFSVGDKIYLARSAEGSGLYIDSGNVVLTALPSEAQYALNGGIYFTVNGQVHMVDDFDFGGGDVFDIASGSRVTAGYDLTAGIVYVHGDLIVEKSVGMTKPNAYYQSGGSTYDALPNAGEGATPDRNVRLLYSLQDGIHACSSKPAVYLFGVTAQMKDVTAKLKAARKEVSSGVYSALICGTVARQNELLTVAAESADVVFDVDVNYLLPLYACVYTGDELTSVDESVVVGYVLARYNADAEEGKFVCRECGVELTLTADTIYDGEDLRIFVTNDKSLLKLAGQAAPVYFGITLTTVFGDIAAAIDASDYEVYYSGSSYNAETPVANQLVTFEQLYGTFTRNGRSYFLIPLKKAGTSNVAGFIAATYEVTFDANISAPVKVVTNSAVTYYNSLSYAVDKVSSGATLLLTKNYSTDNLVIDKSVTIDLNGFALTMTGGDDLIVVGQENIPTVTIRNGNVIGEGEGGSLLKVAKGSLTVSNGTYSYSGVLFDVTVTSSGLTADHIVATGARLMNASGNATLGFVSFTGTEGIVVSGGQIAIVNSDVTVTGTALTVPKTSNSLASVAVSTTSRYTDLTSTTGVAVKVEGEIFGVTFTGSTRYSVRIEGVNAGIVHSAGTVALQNYVTVTSVLGRSSDVSVQNGAVVLSEPASGNAGITLSISGTGIYLVNSGVDHDAILHYNRRSEIEPVLDFGNRPFVIGAFTELATFDGENNNNDAIFTKARYVFPVYTRQEVSGEYAYLTYSDSLKAVLQPSYSQNDSAVWDNAKLYAFGTMTATTQKPDAWDTSFTDYYLDPLGNVRNTSPEWHSDTIYYYYYFTELTEQPSNWATKYDRYYVLDSKAVYAYIANTSSVWDGEKSYYDAQYNVVSSQPADWASEYASYFVREKKKTYVFTSGSMTLSEKTIIPFDCVLKTSGELYIKADIVVCGEIILTDAVTAELPENVADPIAFRVKETGKVTLSERNKKIGKNSRYVIEGELYVSGCNVTFEDNSSGVSDYVLTVASTGKINVGTGVATASLYVTAGRVKIGGTITNHGNLIFYSTVVIRMEDGSVIENFDTVTFNGKVTIGGEITSVGTLFFRDDVTVDENGGIVCTNNAATVDWIANVHVLGSVDMNGAALTLGSAAKALFYQNSTFNSSGTIDCYGEMVFATVNVSITNGINFYMGGTLLLETTLFTGLESSIVYEEDATSYKLLEEEPSDWATAYGSYYSNPGEPITALVCPTWQEDTYYYNTWSYQKKTATIDLSVNYEHGSTLSVTAVHGYSMLWSKHIVATSCIVRGYTVSDYSKQVAYDYSDTAGALIINVTFEDAGIIHWNIAAELGNHVVMCQNVSGDTELSSFRHRKYCTVCGAEYGEEDHVLGGLSIPEEDTSMVINGASYSYTMVSRTCAKCGKNVLFVYQCAYDTTIGDINNYIANTGFRCSLNGVNASTSIHDALSKMSFTESFDSTGYYLFKASKDDQTVYFLLWYDYDYEYENVPDTNLHAKRWENYEGYYSYEQHSYTSITRETLIRNHQSYFVADGNNYVTADIVYNSSLQYYSRTAVTTSGPCYVKVSEDTYELATEGGADKYYLYSDGNYVAAPTNYYTDDGNGTYVKVEYWTAAGITYYTFAKTTVSSSARQSNVLFGECSICHKNGPIIFYYDGNTTANDLRTYLGSGYTVNSLSSSGTITIEGVAYSVLSVRQSSQNRYVLGLQQTGHQLYYDWLDAEKNIHEGKCGDCTSNSGNVSGTHTFTSTAKYVCHNHSAAGKVKYDNVLALQCSVCENYYIWCLNIDDSTTMSGLSALTEAKGYSVVGFTGSDLVSERLNALTEYGTIENAYLVPVCPTGETDATGYVLVTITHAFTCTYENVTYHKKVCSVCGYEERITHTVGQTIKDANDVLGYVCADCGEFIPYHFVMDHLNIIAEFNGLLPEGWQSVETETSKKFYVYMDSHTFTTCELTLLYDGVNDTVLTHILVPVKGNNDETGYVAVYFIPHTMVYDVLGDTDFYDGIFTTKHRAHCTEPDCGKAYEGDHVFDGTYHLEMNSALGVMILTQTCIFCEQKVAVKYTFDDTTRYNAFNALLQPYGYTYYKTSSSVTGSNLVVYEQFSGKGGDYNTSVDVDGDGLDDYFIVEIAEKDNSAQIAGYVLVKFRHHMEYNLSSGDEMDMMVCSVCGYFYTTGHRVAQDRMAIEVGVKKYYYDEADNVEATTTSDAFVTYGDNKKVLMFCFGPDTTIDEVTQYFIGMASFTLYGQYQYKTHGYVCRSGRYIVGIEEKDGRKYLDDWKITQGVFTEYFYQGEFYYRLPLCEARCLFGYNSTDGYTGELEFVLDSEGEPLRVDISGPQFYLLAKYDPNAPKDGYFMYYSRESGNQLVEVASYRELAREDYMRFVNDSEYELATDTINYDEKEYAAITQAETKESAVFYYNDNTKIDDLTGYLIGRTAWSGPNNRGVVTASGFIATGTFGSSATIASLEGDWETLTEGGKTYYIIPLYSHADSTIKYDDYGRFDGTNCTINGISTDPAMYILACKDTTAPDYGYFKKLESDTAIEIASYQNAKAEVLLSNLLDPNSINRNEGDDATLEFTDFFVKASVNGDENILRYIVGLGTTLTDVINDLPDFTYYHDGVLGTGTDNLALLIASYLKDNYYNALTAKLRFGSHRTQYFLPLAYKNAPDVWVANLWLEIELEDMRRQEQVYVKEQGAIIADYEAVFVGLKCSGCQEAAYVEREVTTTTTFAELEQYITIVDYLFDYLTGGDFAAADWSELYYHDGCTANSLLDDPAMVKNARYYNILDTMEYGVYDRHNVCLILLGRMTYEEAGVFTELPVYLLLHIAENN